jgi:hypothetical protein
LKTVARKCRAIISANRYRLLNLRSLLITMAPGTMISFGESPFAAKAVLVFSRFPDYGISSLK